jgi:peptidoglycan/xylan/chitin deacetylase (PgdA/CDA1 family)
MMDGPFASRHLAPVAIEGGAPLLLVVIDTEEEFDWSQPFSRHNIGATSIHNQPLAHRVFERYGIVPSYLVDYPVATSEFAAVLRELRRQGVCEIGAQLHPWVNPPYEEVVNVRHSYPGNLPAPLERAKLQVLTDTIRRQFDVEPVAYKAGRYGFGPNTLAIIEELGYTIDTSVMPVTDFSEFEGPDYADYAARPFWFGNTRRILEVPVTRGLVGISDVLSGSHFAKIDSPRLRRYHVPGLLARLGILERITLTPEGVDHSAHRRLTRALLAQGQRIFTFSYHSSSLAPGNTPYVRSTRDLDNFLRTMDRYFHYFIHEIGGRPISLSELHRRLEGSASPQRAAS